MLLQHNFCLLSLLTVTQNAVMHACLKVKANLKGLSGTMCWLYKQTCGERCILISVRHTSRHISVYLLFSLVAGFKDLLKFE